MKNANAARFMVLVTGAVLVCLSVGAAESQTVSDGKTAKPSDAPAERNDRLPETPMPGGIRLAQIPATGPLHVLAANPRYFTDGSGRAIYLTGSHNWGSLQDSDVNDPPGPFDYAAYLDLMVAHGHNFMRMWNAEQARGIPTETRDIFFSPLPFVRTGPGTALDGKPKFDLTKWNPEYFDRLHQRVAEAGRRGIYVSVMLFNGWSFEIKPHKGRPWLGHPFHRDNNINGIDGDKNNDGEGALEVHTMAIPAVTAVQEAYVRKMIETLNDLDNVLWEICNEDHPESREWQYHMIRFIKECEAAKPKQHPVGMTGYYAWKAAFDNADLFNSPADWISPISIPTENYREDPPASDGRKVILIDTDHIWGVGGGRVWVWKSFTRGLQPIFMDPLHDPGWEGARRAMGHARAYADRMDLAEMTPQNALTSTRYCLAQEGVEYLVYRPGDDRDYRPEDGLFTVRVHAGAYRFEWFNPDKGGAAGAGYVTLTGGDHPFTPPFKGDAVLYLKALPPPGGDRP